MLPNNRQNQRLDTSSSSGLFQSFSRMNYLAFWWWFAIHDYLIHSHEPRIHDRASDYEHCIWVLGDCAIFPGFCSYTFGSSEAKLHPLQLLKSLERASLILPFWFCLCREADKISSCFDTQTSTRWWRLRSKEQSYQAFAKIFDFSLDWRHSLFLFGPQLCLCILYAFSLCKFTCVPLTIEAGVVPKPPTSSYCYQEVGTVNGDPDHSPLPSERNEQQNCLAFITDGSLDYSYSLLQISWCHSWVHLIFFRVFFSEVASPPGCPYAQSQVCKCFSNKEYTLVLFGKP